MKLHTVKTNLNRCYVSLFLKSVLLMLFFYCSDTVGKALVGWREGHRLGESS